MYLGTLLRKRIQQRIQYERHTANSLPSKTQIMPTFDKKIKKKL